MTEDWVWDVETMRNVFTASFEHAELPITACFEISDWTNESAELIDFVRGIRDRGGRLIGFNSVRFDYVLLHFLIRAGRLAAIDLFNKAQSIISAQDDDDDSKWVHYVKPADRFLPQICLFLVNHYDNRARSTGLKALEFAMRSDSIQELPFKIGSSLTRDQVPVLKAYNAHDVRETKKFLHHCRDMLQFREELCVKYPGRDWMNFSDAKIGKEYFILKLEAADIQCYEYGPDGRKPRQTRRQQLVLNDAILPWIQFETPAFQRVIDWLRQQVVTETKGVFKDLTATVDGFTFVFGMGGIHGSVENRVIESSDEMIILDIDVEAYYPSTGIAQGFRPAHYPAIFSDLWAALKQERKQYPKGTAMNLALKLSNNAVFGDSGNQHSVFFDLMMLTSITLNGQMLMLLLAENLLKIGDLQRLQIIQANTDGMTLYLPRGHLDRVQQVIRWWEGITKLTMEQTEYRRMFIRDVNNYIAEDMKGKVKSKGAYMHQRGWHQDHSALVVPKVAELALLKGAPIRETTESWPDLHDFMLRIKVPRSGYLQWGEDQVQNTSRYAVVKNGKPLRKWLPPLKGKTEWRSFSVESGWTVQVCNRIEDASDMTLDYDFYAREVEKLVLGLR